MNYSMEMTRRKKMVSLTLEPELVARLEAWLAEQEFPPHKNTVIAVALSEWLDKRETSQTKTAKGTQDKEQG